MELRRGEIPDRDALVELYDACGWTAYTRDAEGLERAVRGSQDLVTAWEGGALVGLARAITDGASILYLQDVLVSPEHRRKGIGSVLVRDLLERHPTVRQKVLLADDDPVVEAFHRAMGYAPVGEAEGGPLVAYVRFDG